MAGWALRLAIAAGTVELVIRWANPEPRAQVIDMTKMPMVTWREGLPLWRARGSDARETPECAPGAVEVLMVGSSITFGVGLAPADAVSGHLQRRLNADGSAWCVRNLAEPGYIGDQKRLVAEVGIARWHPRVVIFEVWGSDGGNYFRVGDTVVGGRAVRRDEDGWPRPPIPVPTWLHHPAMTHLASWRYATIALSSVDDDADKVAWEREVPARLTRVDAAVKGQGKLLVWLAAGLDSPFSAQAAWHPESADYGQVLKWGGVSGVPVVDVAAAWTSEDPAALGVDRICHLNSLGSDKLAALLEPRVRELAAAAASPP